MNEYAVGISPYFLSIILGIIVSTAINFTYNITKSNFHLYNILRQKQAYNVSLNELKNANCNVSRSNINCKCKHNFVGKTCELYLGCKKQVCQNGGTCSKHQTLEQFLCSCLPGFTGYDCETNIDDCLHNLCIYGTCIDDVNHFFCKCEPGYNGTFCDSEANECLSNPCSNGKCIDNFNQFFCICDKGYEGRQCDKTLLVFNKNVKITNFGAFSFIPQRYLTQYYITFAVRKLQLYVISLSRETNYYLSSFSIYNKLFLQKVMYINITKSVHTLKQTKMTTTKLLYNSVIDKLFLLNIKKLLHFDHQLKPITFRSLETIQNYPEKCFLDFTNYYKHLLILTNYEVLLYNSTNNRTTLFNKHYKWNSNNKYFILGCTFQRKSFITYHSNTGNFNFYGKKKKHNYVMSTLIIYVLSNI